MSTREKLDVIIGTSFAIAIQALDMARKSAMENGDAKQSDSNR